MEQDHYLYATQTVGRKLEDPAPFIKKETFYINDQQNGNYNGEITFDTASLQGSNKWVAWNEGMIVVPYVVSVQANADVAAEMNNYMIGLKAGTHHIIDSLAVDWNGTQVVQSQPYTNFLVHYQMMASYSQDDVKKWGSQNLFIPDNPHSINHEAAVSSSGRYFTNNRINPNKNTGRTFVLQPAKNYENPVLANDGFKARMDYANYPIRGSANQTIAADGFNTNAMLTTAVQAQAAGINYVSENAVAAAGKVIYLVIHAVIRLKDIANFFDQIPLVRGGWARITLRYNAANVVVSKTGAVNTATTVSQTSTVITTSGNTVPFMLASGIKVAGVNLNADSALSVSAYEPNTNVFGGLDANETLTIQGNVSRTSQVGATSPAAFNNCRLYLNQYIMDPVLEDSLRSAGVDRTFGYTDFINQNITLSTASSVNALLNNGIRNAKYLVVIPYVAAADTGNILDFQSVFSSSPATTAPYASLIKFNVQIGGSNVFQQDVDYDFQTYENEVAGLLAVDGGSSTGNTSGLLTRAAWSSGYRYYVVDLARRLKSEDPIPKSIQLLATNNTSKNLVLYCFMVYEKRVTLNLLTSQITQILM